MEGSPRVVTLAAFALALTTACGGVERPEGWTEASHGKNAAPAYDIVFPQGKVQRLDIVIAAEDWQTMQDDMTGMVGAFGSGGGAGGGTTDGGVPPELVQACEGKAEGDACTATLNGSTFTSTCGLSPDGAQLLCRSTRPPRDGGTADGGGVPGGGNRDLIPNTPVYVPSTVHFEGKTWTYVGVRFKGNSSLLQAWRSGVGKLPLRLNFDEFEDAHPEIEDQRFHGFEKLSLSNAVADPSLIRNKVATDIFRAAGVPTSYTAFVALYVDHGEGSQYYGLYTLVEDIDASVVNRAFGDDSGALYEANGVGARWQTFDSASFEPESKAAENNWASVEAAITALNSDRTDAAAWRARLEERLDVDGFLKWLAVNTVLQNWDTYGAMPHNYYLYAHPGENGRLRWITWDHDRSMGDGMRRSTTLTQSNVDATWPLIRFLMDDPVYWETYARHMLEVVQGPLAPDSFQERLRAEHALIAPWVVGENAEQQGFTFLRDAQQFQDALTGTSGLLNFAARRQGEVQATFGNTTP